MHLSPTLATLAITVAIAGCGISEPYVSARLEHPTVLAAPADSIRESLFLIGDAGSPTTEYREPTFVALEQLVSVKPDKNLVVFLGDNIYHRGLPEKGDELREHAEWILDEQVSILTNSGAQGIFIPGNHDWDYHGKEGLAAIKRQQRYLEDLSNHLARFQPTEGCPGPVVTDFGSHLRIIVVDTEWWLHEYDKPRQGGGECGIDPVEDSVFTALGNALDAPPGRIVAVVAHHPPETYGNHGGFFTWKDHLFPLRHAVSWLWLPLPIIGSVYPLSRNLGVSNQDLSGSLYRQMVHHLDSVFTHNPPLFFAAGHEHTLQVLQGERPYTVLVSGNGMEDHDPSLTPAPSMLFGDIHPGFMRVDVLVDGRVRLGVIRARDREGSPEEIFSMWLKGTTPVSQGR